MVRYILAMVLSAIAMLIIMPPVLQLLHKLNFGQTEYELGPHAHSTKQGTPIMGGLAFAAVTCVVALVVHAQWFGVWDMTLALIAVSLCSMLIGFADDYIKAVKKRNLGLIWWQKIIGQVLVAVGFSTYCYFHPLVGSSILIPFANVEWDLGLFYIPVMSMLMIFMINSANLQDGVDGLLSSSSAVGNIAWAMLGIAAAGTATAVMGAERFANYQNLAIFALALTGSLIGFLRFNRYPAMVFMGDTGSMFIGGATVGMAMLLRMPILLLLIAFTMVMSSLSVILQRAYFKLTHGKRIFKMSPIHHHFELCGMTEKQIVLMYTLVTIALSVLAVLSVLVF